MRWQPVIQIPSGEYAIPVFFSKEKTCNMWIGSHYLLIESITMGLQGLPVLDVVARATQ